jgi:hypothetical protein
MGHSSIRITLDTYAKAFEKADHAQADRIAARLLAGDRGSDTGA